MKKILAITLAVFFLSGQQMQAGDKEWSVVGKVLTGIFAIKVLDDITTPKTVVHHVTPQPVVVQQQPVVVQQPVVSTPTVVYQPAPVISTPTVIYQAPPVVVYQPPIIHCQPPVMYHYGPRRSRSSFTFRWHGN